jgi:hypothetical protein
MKIKLDTSNFESLVSENIEYREKYLEDVKILRKDWNRIEDAIITRASSLLPYKEFPQEIKVTISLEVKEETHYSITVHPNYTSPTEAFVSKVAHKVHTILCYDLLKYDVDAIDEKDKSIIRTIETIQLEGIGDHIDIEYFIYGENHTFSEGKYATVFKESIRNISKSITQFNEIFKKIAQDVAQKERLGEELREFTPSYGNPLGYYMVNIILKNSYLDELLNNIGNPFHFFRLYNKAVLKDRVEIPFFSEETIEQLSLLEKKYVESKKD